MVEIMIEMYMFDMKIQDFHELSSLADTTLVYEAILRQHGYSFKEFNRSLTHHLQNPEKLKKKFNAQKEQLITRRNALKKALDSALKSTEALEQEPLYQILLPLLPAHLFPSPADSLPDWHIDMNKWWRMDTIPAPTPFLKP